MSRGGSVEPGPVPRIPGTCASSHDLTVLLFGGVGGGHAASGARGRLLPFAEEAGVPWLGFHALRHFFAHVNAGEWWPEESADLRSRWSKSDSGERRMPSTAEKPR